MVPSLITLKTFSTSGVASWSHESLINLINTTQYSSSLPSETKGLMFSGGIARENDLQWFKQ